MHLEIQQKLYNDKQMAEFLKQNSQWYKYLNRNPDLWKEFTAQMKEKYKVSRVDKIEGIMENIDLISNVLGILK